MDSKFPEPIQHSTLECEGSVCDDTQTMHDSTNVSL